MECYVCGEDHEPVDVHGEPEVFIQPSIHSMSEVYAIARDWAQEFGKLSEELERELAWAIPCYEEEENCPGSKNQEDAVSVLDDFLGYGLSESLDSSGFLYIGDEDFMAVFKEEESNA